MGRTARGLWLLVLLLLSACYCPALLLAPVLIFLYRHWLQRAVGGVSGDCLGAGVEVTELGLLLCVVLVQASLAGISH